MWRSGCIIVFMNREINLFQFQHVCESHFQILTHLVATPQDRLTSTCRSLMMFAKSFLALGGNASLIGTKTAQPPLRALYLPSTPLKPPFIPPLSTRKLTSDISKLTSNQNISPLWLITERAKLRPYFRRFWMTWPMRDWQCVMCNVDFRGEKKCPVCKTGTTVGSGMYWRISP